MDKTPYKQPRYLTSQQKVDEYGSPLDPQIIRGSIHVREGETLEAAAKRHRAQYPLTPDECYSTLTDEDRRTDGLLTTSRRSTLLHWY